MMGTQEMSSSVIKAGKKVDNTYSHIIMKNLVHQVLSR